MLHFVEYQVEGDGEKRGGPIVVEMAGFLQKDFPPVLRMSVERMYSRIRPRVVVSLRPNYNEFALSGCPTWNHYSAGLAPFLSNPEIIDDDLLFVTDSFGVILVDQIGQLLNRRFKVIAFRVPRIGDDRADLRDWYNRKADGCADPGKLAYYRSSIFPALPEDPEAAARILRGAARSGHELEGFSSSDIVAVTGFEDKLHPASAREEVIASGGSVVDSIDEALAALKLI